MQQREFTRRLFLKQSGAAAAAAGLSPMLGHHALAAEPLKIWTIGVAKVGEAQARAAKTGAPWRLRPASRSRTAKSGSADQAIQKFIVGDGNKLYDAMTDNGGGMEDALASQKAICRSIPRRSRTGTSCLISTGGRAR